MRKNFFDQLALEAVKFQCSSFSLYCRHNLALKGISHKDLHKILKPKYEALAVLWNHLLTTPNRSKREEILFTQFTRAGLTRPAPLKLRTSNKTVEPTNKVDCSFSDNLAVNAHINTQLMIGHSFE